MTPKKMKLERLKIKPTLMEGKKQKFNAEIKGMLSLNIPHSSFRRISVLFQSFLFLVRF